MIRTVLFCALVTGGLAGCCDNNGQSNTGTSGGSASNGGTATGGGSSGASSSGGTCNSALAGTWTLIGVTCNGVPAIPPLSTAYTAPNVTTEIFTCDTKQQNIALDGGDCVVTWNWSMTLSPTSFSIVPTTVHCSPTYCDVGDCGELGIVDTDAYTISGNTLTATSNATGSDGSPCTGNGQSNPLVYTLTKQ